MGKFRELIVWQRAKDLSVFVYKVTSNQYFQKDQVAASEGEEVKSAAAHRGPEGSLLRRQPAIIQVHGPKLAHADPSRLSDCSFGSAKRLAIRSSIKSSEQGQRSA